MSGEIGSSKVLEHGSSDRLQSQTVGIKCVSIVDGRLALEKDLFMRCD